MTVRPCAQKDDDDAGRRALASAAEVFVRRGYWKTSWEDLVRASRLDPDRLEALVGDRERCFLRAYDRAMDAVREELKTSTPDASPWSARLAVALRTVMETIDSHPVEARLVLVESMAATAATMAHHIKTIDSLAPFFHGDADVAGGRQRPSRVALLPGGLTFMLANHIRHSPGAPVAELFGEALYTLLLPCVGYRRAAAALESVGGDAPGVSAPAPEPDC